MNGRINETRLLASVCKESFGAFCKEFWHTVVAEDLIWNWHMQVVCDEIQACFERIFAGKAKEHDLLINIPPGSSKSTLCSVMAPAWAWTRMPSFRTIGASYAHPLALDLARRCRDVVKSELYQACFPHVQLRGDQDTKGFFTTTKGGLRYAVGANGAVTGIHAHALVVDDPLDPNRAASDAELFQINEWIKNTLNQRKVSKLVSVMVMVMQRLHQDDPSANMARKDRVRHLCIPATTEFDVKPPELVNHYTDGLMDPVRLPKSILDAERHPEALGESGFSCQYGQDPVPAGGGMFKTANLRWGRVPEAFRRPAVRFWDKAITKVRAGARSRAAFTVGLRMGIDNDGRVWITHVRRFREDSAVRERIIKRTAKTDTKATVIGVEVEPGSGGKESALSTLRHLHGWTVKLLPARQDKGLRADPFSEQVNAGNVYLPESMRVGNSWIGWAKDLVDELRHWPHSKFKDQGDSAAGAYFLLSQGRVRVGPLKRKEGASK